MSNEEIAMNLTLKAMEEKHIAFSRPAHVNDNVSIESSNDFNAKQISDFYKNILKTF